MGFVANELADALADEGANAHQLPPMVVKETMDTDKEARAVQQHLVAVLEYIGEKGVPPPGMRQPPTAIEEELKNTMHVVNRAEGVLTCTVCGEQRAEYGDWRRWLRKICRPEANQSNKWHRSHQMSWHRGLPFCRVCGA